MNKREIASLVCKILGVYIIIQGINVFSSVVLSASIATPNQVVHETLLNTIFSLVYVVFGVSLWLLSDKLSAIMVTGGDLSNPGSGIKGSELQRVSFSVLGLFFIGNSIPKLIVTLTTIYSMSGLPNSTSRLILGSLGPIAEFVIGVGIFLGSHSLVNFLNYMRTAGLKREERNQDQGHK